MIVVNGQGIETPDFFSRCWLEPGKRRLRLGSSDCRPRQTRWVRLLMFHTTIGDEPQVVLPGAGKQGGAEQLADFYASDPAHNGCHMCIDYDGSVACYADLLLDAAYHATSVNETSIGVEIKQTAKLEIYQAQIATAAKLAHWVCDTMGIQKQMHWPYLGDTYAVARLAAGGRDCTGVIGHRDQTNQRGQGDPGDAVLLAIQASGFESFNFQLQDDKAAWHARQGQIGKEIGMTLDCDGIPGPATLSALRRAGYRNGIWMNGRVSG
jgi:hypothetical protein